MLNWEGLLLVVRRVGPVAVRSGFGRRRLRAREGADEGEEGAEGLEATAAAQDDDAEAAVEEDRLVGLRDGGGGSTTRRRGLRGDGSSHRTRRRDSGPEVFIAKIGGLRVSAAGGVGPQHARPAGLSGHRDPHLYGYLHRAVSPAAALTLAVGQRA